MRYGCAAMVLIAGVLGGCATTAPPRSMTCEALKMQPVTNPGQRVELQQFSIQMPADAARWCLGSSAPGFLALYTHPLMGRHIESPERRMAFNTMAMIVIVLKHGEPALENVEALRHFVEDWIGTGFGVESTGGELEVDHRRQARFEVRQFDVRSDPDPQAACVRYDYEMLERDNPRTDGLPLTLRDHGRICVHPKDRSRIVLASFSERYPQGGQIDPALFPMLEQSVAEPFIDSLRF